MQVKTHKACRRYGIKLCQSDKCPVIRRNYKPGIHGNKRRARLTEYGTQLREKQIAKAIYGIMEKQFSNYYKKAINQQGDTGELIQQMLETRLDNAVFRAGFAKTRPLARQLVSHGMFLVNGKKTNIPSYQIKVKDEISIKPEKIKAKVFNDLEKKLEKYTVPSWLALDLKNNKVKVVSRPSGNELENTFNPRLIVEFYSK
ncbi:MAG: 30S ribosomal protein S4 [Parcubacteria group bacterium]|jgi:small subunit ribosomal protein S4|nr:30S ribosomal protein S4 [Parcubacteria group bacterium]|tara:strand:- start:15236 stop:15838 length:603 start_codon:yes stop_codon:yes gene_type:complete